MGRGRSKIVPLTARKSYLIVSLVNRDKTKGKRKTKGEKMKERKNSKEVELKLRQYNRTIIFILCLWIVHGKRTSKRRNEKERMYEINLVDKKKKKCRDQKVTTVPSRRSNWLRSIELSIIVRKRIDRIISSINLIHYKVLFSTTTR